jgi:amino acid transporter
MELDDLKGMINQKLMEGSPTMTENNFTHILKGKASSVISKIKKSLWFEIAGCVLVVFLFIGIALFSSHSSLKIYSGVFGVIFIPFSLIYFYLLKKINEFDQSVLPIKENLHQLIKMLEDFTRRYFQFNMALLPICFLFAFYLGYNEKEPISVLDNLSDKLRVTKSVYIGFLIGYCIAMVFGLVYLTKWYIRKLYGKYIDQLKVLLAELKVD